MLGTVDGLHLETGCGNVGNQQLNRAFIGQTAQMRSITTEKIPTFFGLPTEKVFRRTSLTRHLLDNDGFAPTAANHSIVKQGFLGEVLDFARRTERKN